MFYPKSLTLIAILILSSGCLPREQTPKKTITVGGGEAPAPAPVSVPAPAPTPTMVVQQPITIIPETAPPPPPPPPPATPVVVQETWVDPIPQEEFIQPVFFDPSSIYSPYLRGAYANNYKLKQFINKMVNKHGFSREFLNGIFSTVQRDERALKKYHLIGKPSTAKLTKENNWDMYRKNFINASHVNNGVQFWKENQYYLDKAFREYGVPPEYILGIMGVETNYGRNTGDHRILDTLTTLSIEYKKRSKFFTTQLENLLLLAKEQGIDPRSIKGSYGGAFGLVQFMPDSFRTYTVDFDNNGQINLFTKADAIGSVANFFVKKGKWNPNIPVATMVRYPKARFYGLKTGYKTKYSQQHLLSLGMRPVDDFYGYRGDVSLIKLPRYNRDELWWGTPNFTAIARYNPREFYVMAVHQLAQIIRNEYWKEMQGRR